jgi:hypothetical protein
MTRIEIEIKLNRDRAWTLETWAALSAEDLTRDLTVSRDNPTHSGVRWITWRIWPGSKPSSTRSSADIWRMTRNLSVLCGTQMARKLHAKR